MPQEKNINHCKTGNWYGKPYNFFGDYLWNKYNCRVLKLPINANLSCPNRNGKISYDGCIFCSDDGSASPTAAGIVSIRDQMDNAKNNFRRSDAETRYIAYFQAFTNTNAPVDVLKKLYDTAVDDNEVIGLMIGTRPDCLDDENLKLIQNYIKKKFELWLEIGIQSFHEKSLEFLKRGHGADSSINAIKNAAELEIPICVHIILGIPGESWEDMMHTANKISSLPIKGVKLHHLHVIKGTQLEEIYKTGITPMLSQKEFVSTACDFMERLRPDIIIHRLFGDREISTLVAPRWGLHKGTVLKAIEDEFKKRGTYQGFLYEK